MFPSDPPDLTSCRSYRRGHGDAHGRPRWCRPCMTAGSNRIHPPNRCGRKPRHVYLSLCYQAIISCWVAAAMTVLSAESQGSPPVRRIRHYRIPAIRAGRRVHSAFRSLCERLTFVRESVYRSPGLMRPFRGAMGDHTQEYPDVPPGSPTYTYPGSKGA